MSRIKSLARQVRQQPEDSFSKFALALELLKKDGITQARILFEDIRKSDPGYLGVYYHLGKLYNEIGENKKAYETYKKGIQVAVEQNDLHTKSELETALLELELEMTD